MIGQRTLPKIAVVIMDGCGRIRVSFRDSEPGRFLGFGIGLFVLQVCRIRVII